MNGVGDLVSDLQQLVTQDGIAEGLVYIRIDSNLGSIAFDPAGPSDPRVQAILQELGIHVTLGFGPVPEIAPADRLSTHLLGFALPLAGAAAGFLMTRSLKGVAIGAGLGYFAARPDLFSGSAAAVAAV